MVDQKRFGMVKTKTYELYVPVDEMKIYNFSGFEDELDCIRIVNALNDLEELRKENGRIANKYLEENEWLKSEIQKLYNFVKIDVDNNIEVYPKSLMEPILEILKIIGDVE